MSSDGKNVKAERCGVVFVNSSFSAYSVYYEVPRKSRVVLLPSNQQFEIDDEKVICHEGGWLLNGQPMSPPTFPNQKEHGVQIRDDGTVVVQGIGGSQYVESHLHRWYVKGQGATSQPCLLGCEYVYGDGLPCEVEQRQFGDLTGWGSRYYALEVRAK